MDYKLKRFRMPPLRFEGEMIASVSGDEGQPRYQVLRLYRTTNDQYVLESLGHSRIDGERTLRYVFVLDTPEQVCDQLERRSDAGQSYLTELAIELIEHAAKVDERIRDADLLTDDVAERI
jgi:hypothetical protein